MCNSNQGLVGIALKINDTSMKDFECLVCGWFVFEHDFKTGSSGNWETCPTNYVIAGFIADDPDSYKRQNWDNPEQLEKKCIEVTEGWTVDSNNCVNVSISHDEWEGVSNTIDCATAEWDNWFACPFMYMAVELTRLTESERQVVSLRCCKILQP